MRRSNITSTPDQKTLAEIRAVVARVRKRAKADSLLPEEAIALISDLLRDTAGVRDGNRA